MAHDALPSITPARTRPHPAADTRLRPQQVLRPSWAATATDPALHGRRAVAWLSVWDSASVSRRVCMLEALKALHSTSNSNAIEDDLGDAAPLLLSRVTSWWKLRYGAWVAETVRAAASAVDGRAASSTAAAAAAAAHGSSPVATTARAAVDKAGGKAAASPAHSPTGTRAAHSGGPTFLHATGAAEGATPRIAGAADASQATAAPSQLSPPPPSPSTSSELLAQVGAITLFLRGSRFLLQFVESGGAATLTHCLELASRAPAGVLVQERRAATLLLLHISNAGRVYREMVGDEEGLLHILRALQRETDAAVAAPLTELLAVLGQGHPRLAGSVQTGLIRVLASGVQPSPPRRSVLLAEFPPAQTTRPARLSEVVVLHTARALRALQLQKEQHHYAQFQASNSLARGAAVAAGAVPGGGGGGAGAVLEAGVDYVPIVGMDDAVNTYGFAGSAAAPAAGTGAGMRTSTVALSNALLRPLTRGEYLDTLFYLALDDEHVSFRVEGSELLSLAAKNLHLTQEILMRCLDTVDDDEYVITAEDEDVNAPQVRLRRQRRQLSCGRTAVMLLTSRPMTAQRRQLLAHLVAQRSGHLTILKHLRLTGHGDSAAVVDGCHALQFIVRSAAEMQRHHMDHSRPTHPGKSAASAQGGGAAAGGGSGGDGGAAGAVWLRVTEGVQAALGEVVFQLLLFQDLAEPDRMAVLRAARAAVVPLGGEDGVDEDI